MGLDRLSFTTLAALERHVADDLPLWLESDFFASYDLPAVEGLPHWLSPLSLNDEISATGKDL